jgi:predicted amidophosphoribosyltransferase
MAENRIGFALRGQGMYAGAVMSSAERQRICPKCRAFIPRKGMKCPYCGRPIKVATAVKKRCRLCGGLEFKTIPLGEAQPGQKKVQKITVCGVCGKQV